LALALVLLTAPPASTPGVEKSPAPQQEIVTVQHINNLITAKPKQPDWNAAIQPQLQRAEQQREQAAAEAAAAAAKAAADAQAVAAAQVAPAREVQPAQPQVQVASAVGGTCGSWIAAAGITDPVDALAVINIESGCNPNARNASSGACGIGQQLPCGKWPHAWNDPVGGLIDMQAYVFGTYGSWANALAHERSHGWY
jgi:hypothetical protein